MTADPTASPCLKLVNFSDNEMNKKYQVGLLSLTEFKKSDVPDSQVHGWMDHEVKDLKSKGEIS